MTLNLLDNQLISQYYITSKYDAFKLNIRSMYAYQTMYLLNRIGKEVNKDRHFKNSSRIHY